MNSSEALPAGQQYWDVTGQAIDPQTYAETVAQFNTAATKFHRFAPLYTLITGIGFFASVILFFIFSYGGLLIFIPCSLLFHWQRRMSQETRLIEPLRQIGWLYVACNDPQRKETLEKQFPALFSYGHGQWIDEEVWGTAALGSNSYPFWQARLHVAVGSGKSEQNFTQALLAIPVHNTIPTPLYIRAYSLGVGREGLGNLVRLESEEVNNLFAVYPWSNDATGAEDIFEYLNPATQEHLISLLNTAGPYALFIDNSVAVFTFAALSLPDQTEQVSITIIQRIEQMVTLINSMDGVQAKPDTRLWEPGTD